MDPATIAMIAQFALPGLAAAFGSKEQPKDPNEMLRLLEAHFGKQLAPAIRAAVRQGSTAGASVQQNFRQAAGNAGALRTGQGAAGTGLAISAAGNRASDARLKGEMEVARLSAEALPSALASDLGSLPHRTSRFQVVLASAGAFAGRVTAADGTPIGGARVRLDGVFPGGHSLGSRSLEDGTYRVGHIPQGSYPTELSVIHRCLVCNYK